MDTVGVSHVAIYVLIDPISHEIRYVGWISGSLARRLQRHVADSTKGLYKRARWISRLKRLGYRPQIELVQMVPAAAWQEAERYWIAYYRSLGCQLVNGTDGGEGTLGQKHSAETRKRMSRDRKGRPSPKKGVPLPVEVKAKLREAAIRQFQDPEMRAAVSRVHKGKSISDEHKAVLAEATKRRWAAWRANGSYTSAETRANIAAAAKGRRRPPPMSPETKAKISAARMGHEVTAETKAKMAATKRARADAAKTELSWKSA